MFQEESLKYPGSPRIHPARQPTNQSKGQQLLFVGCKHGDHCPPLFDWCLKSTNQRVVFIHHYQLKRRQLITYTLKLLKSGK